MVGKMNIMILTQRQNPFGKDILYAPELETKHLNIVAKVYPAVYYHIGEPEYFMIADEQIGEYEEQSRHPEKGLLYECLGGKAEIERRFREMYEKHVAKLNALS